MQNSLIFKFNTHVGNLLILTAHDYITFNSLFSHLKIYKVVFTLFHKLMEYVYTIAELLSQIKSTIHTQNLMIKNYHNTQEILEVYFEDEQNLKKSWKV
jgi:hypothetical protein